MMDMSFNTEVQSLLCTMGLGGNPQSRLRMQ